MVRHGPVPWSSYWAPISPQPLCTEPEVSWRSPKLMATGDWLRTMAFLWLILADYSILFLSRVKKTLRLWGLTNHASYSLLPAVTIQGCVHHLESEIRSLNSLPSPNFQVPEKWCSGSGPNSQKVSLPPQQPRACSPRRSPEFRVSSSESSIQKTPTWVVQPFFVGKNINKANFSHWSRYTHRQCKYNMIKCA